MKIKTSKVMDEHICIRWTDQEWVDVLERNMFLTPKTLSRIEHRCFSVGTKKYGLCRAVLSIEGCRVSIDYSSDDWAREWNEKIEQDWAPGTLVLEFFDLSFTRVQKFSWIYTSGVKRHAKHAKQVPIEVTGGGSYLHSKGIANRQNVSVATRAKNFRKLLLGAYDERCCITDCKVVGVLEGAHIDSHSGATSDRVPNGLLVRRDVHRLFDLNMLGIDPQTMIVCASTSLSKLNYEPYQKLIGKVCRSPVDAWNRADTLALTRRWKKFQASKASASND